MNHFLSDPNYKNKSLIHYYHISLSANHTTTPSLILHYTEQADSVWKTSSAPERDAIERPSPLEGQNFIGTLRKSVNIVSKALQSMSIWRRFLYHDDSAILKLNYLTVDARYNADLTEPAPFRARYNHLDEDTAITADSTCNVFDRYI